MLLTLRSLIRSARALAAQSPLVGDRPEPAIWTLLGVMFLNLMGFGIVVPLLPFYAQSFNAEPWQIGLLFSAFPLGTFFGEPIWGRLSDKIGRRPLLISTVCATATCYFALAFAPNFIIAFLVRFVGGICSGNASVVQGYIADVTAPEKRTARMSMLGAAFNVGFIVGPAIGGLLAHPELGPAGFRIPLLVASGLGFCSAIGVALFVKESRRAPKAVPILEAGKSAELAAERPQILTHPIVGKLVLVTFCAGFGFTGIESTFGLWGQARFDWGPRELGFMFGCVGLFAAFCQSFITAPLSRKYGEARMLAVGMGISAGAALLQTFSTGMAMSTILLMTTALGNSVAFPNVAAIIARVADPNRLGQTLGANNAAGAFARVVGPFTAGLVFAGVSINGAFYLQILMSIPAIALALLVERRTAGVGALAPQSAPIAEEGQDAFESESASRKATP